MSIALPGWSTNTEKSSLDFFFEDEESEFSYTSSEAGSSPQSEISRKSVKRTRTREQSETERAVLQLEQNFDGSPLSGSDHDDADDDLLDRSHINFVSNELVSTQSLSHTETYGNVFSQGHVSSLSQRHYSRSDIVIGTASSDDIDEAEEFIIDEEDDILSSPRSGVGNFSHESCAFDEDEEILSGSNGQWDAVDTSEFSLVGGEVTLASDRDGGHSDRSGRDAADAESSLFSMARQDTTFNSTVAPPAAFCDEQHDVTKAKIIGATHQMLSQHAYPQSINPNRAISGSRTSCSDPDNRIPMKRSRMDMDSDVAFSTERGEDHWKQLAARRALTVHLAGTASMEVEQKSSGDISFNNGMDSLPAAVTHHQQGTALVADPSSQSIVSPLDAEISSIYQMFGDTVSCNKEFAQEIYDTLREAERRRPISPQFMLVQKIGATEQGRRSSILRMLANRFRLHIGSESVHLAAYVFDKCLDSFQIASNVVADVAAVSVVIASKLEEYKPLIIEKAIRAELSSTKDCSQLANLEKRVLFELDYSFSFATPYMYANYFHSYLSSPVNVIKLTNFLLELCLLNSAYRDFGGSRVAQTAVSLSHALHYKSCGGSDTPSAVLLKVERELAIAGRIPVGSTRLIMRHMISHLQEDWCSAAESSAWQAYCQLAHPDTFHEVLPAPEELLMAIGYVAAP